MEPSRMAKKILVFFLNKQTTCCWDLLNFSKQEHYTLDTVNKGKWEMASPIIWQHLWALIVFSLSSTSPPPLLHNHRQPEGLDSMKCEAGGGWRLSLKPSVEQALAGDGFGPFRWCLAIALECLRLKPHWLFFSTVGWANSFSSQTCPTQFCSRYKWGEAADDGSSCPVGMWLLRHILVLQTMSFVPVKRYHRGRGRVRDCCRGTKVGRHTRSWQQIGMRTTNYKSWTK